MVLHQTPSVQTPTLSMADLLEVFQELPPATFSIKDASPGIATVNDMVACPREFDADFSGHNRNATITEQWGK